MEKEKNELKDQINKIKQEYKDLNDKNNRIEINIVKKDILIKKLNNELEDIKSLYEKSINIL
jgi:predicted  nucleic acid-binding Zn-ribbon protein